MMAWRLLLGVALISWAACTKAMPRERVVRMELKRNVPLRRRLGNATFSLDAVPLGVGAGTHYAELYMGLPPQKASVIVDTGSHLTALPCTSCVDCGTHTDPAYDVSKSTTARFMSCSEFDGCSKCDNNQCRISQSYAEGSMWSALLVDELCWVGPLDATGAVDSNATQRLQAYGVRFPIGCQTKETGLFIGQKENGIMGLSQDRNTFLAYLVAAGHVDRNLFTLCFAQDGGQMVLGGTDDSVHVAPPVFTPLVSKTGWFTVELLDIHLGNRSVGLPSSTYNQGRGIIVDSGTTDSFFPAAAASAFNALFLELAGRTYLEGTEEVLTEADVHALPSLFLKLRGLTRTSMITLEIPPSQYLTRTSDEGHYTANFHFTEPSGSGVLGATTMLNYNVIFDMDARRVGFAPARCDANGRALRFGPGVSSGPLELPDVQSIWFRYETLLTVLIAVSFMGVVLLCLTYVVRRKCGVKSRWVRLSTRDHSPSPRPTALNALDVSPELFHEEHDSPGTPPTPPSPQRRLSRSPDLHSIPESDSE
ncbi:aspartyl protease family A01B [Achlya hypogyna]|uniref:Aspartyl protease family A01B n=1 Tax=Achlya hypogyna TaxID=1202772 RepID=A0A1V9YMU8_ACHHY|nr:aspartyl protease family A01B [Achlya hypogyna]